MLRPILLKFTNNDGEWYNFVKEAKQNSWVAFAEDYAYIKKQTIANDHVFEIKKRNYGVRHKTGLEYKKKNCMIHGWCQHNTNECRTIDELKKKGLKIYKEKKKEVHVLDEEKKNSSSDENFLNKNQLAYLYNFNNADFLNSKIKK
ncbi:hypothetical protein COBT_000690 [Conglomerata obtusa]